jgi:hypothetical protein
MSTVRYSKVTRRLWGDRDFRDLSAPPPSARELWLYLLTCPEQTAVPGIFRAFEGGISDALGWPLEGFREAFSELVAKGFVRADWKAGVVVLPKAFRHNQPESPNHVLGWRSAWEEIPECDLKTEYFHMLKPLVEGLGKAYLEAFRKAFGDPYPETCRYQEQEQEQEQDIEKERGERARRATPVAPESATGVRDRRPNETDDGCHGAAVRGWHATLAQRTGRTITRPTGGELRRLIQIFRDHAPDLSSRIEWATKAAEDFAGSGETTPNVHRFDDWLTRGRRGRAREGRGERARDAARRPGRLALGQALPGHQRQARRVASGWRKARCRMTAHRVNRAPEIRQALSDPTRVLEALGILGDGKQRRRQAGGWLICCPIHADRTPSLSVQAKPEGLLWRCWGCGAAGDVISLVAAVRGTSLRGRGFRDTLVECARLAGLWEIVDELEGRSPSAGTGPRTRFQEHPGPLPHLASPEPQEAPRDYPPASEVSTLWDGCRPVSDDTQVSEYLAQRAIDPDQVEGRDLARVLPFAGGLPAWARCRGGTWREACYRLILPMFDVTGVVRTVRAWRVGGDSDLPKRLPPSGHKASGVVMADSWAAMMLQGTRAPTRVVVAEGEPDFLTWATRVQDARTAVVGIVSGSWTTELSGRFPVGCRVDVRTDHDAAGERYAAEVLSGLRRRCFVYRSSEVV